MLAFAIVLALVSCGDQRTLEAHGIGIELPEGWVGRIVPPEPGFATHVIAGNFDVPSGEDWLGPMTSSSMSSESIYVWLAVQPVFEEMQEGRWLESELPIRVGDADLGNLEGFYSPVEAGRWLLIADHAIIVVVGFGREDPDDDAFDAANRVLATLELSD